MEGERTLETLRHRLLRLVAGLLAAVVFVSALPLSRDVSRWIGGVAFSILSRAETAAHYLGVAMARRLAAQAGIDVEPERLLAYGVPENSGREGGKSLSELRDRLEALLALLEDLPRFGMRLLRNTERRVRRMGRTRRKHRDVACRDMLDLNDLRALRLGSVRIERPPDKTGCNVQSAHLPPDFGWEAKAVGL